MSDPRLDRLLEHPAIWRGAGAARAAAVSTGFPELDARLPGEGWPQTGLVEILIPELGVGELSLLLPALGSLSRRATARWCACIAPPFEPFAPALAAHGLDLERLLVVHTEAPLWPCEQSLRSGACDAVIAFVRRIQTRALRRLQLAAEQGRTLGFLLRTLSQRTLQEPSCATLRLAVQPAQGALRITLLKCRGARRGSLELTPPALCLQSARQSAI